MSAVPLAPRRIFGVAVPGSAVDGHSVWVCRAHPGAAGIRVESVDPVVDLPGGVAAGSEVMRWLVGKVIEAPRSAWGIGAPFGVASWSDGSDDWAVRVRDAAAASGAWSASGADETDAMRRTDEECGIGHGADLPRSEAAGLVIRDLLAPLLSQAAVVVLPQQPTPLLPAGAPAEMAARVPSIYVVETSPAALAATFEPPLARDRSDRRMESYRRLLGDGLVRPVARRLRERIASARGATDALLCAVGAARAMRRSDHGRLHAEPRYRLQGYIYC